MGTNNQKNDQNIIPNDADKQQKGVNVPNLRFRQFQNIWIKKSLHDITKKINIKNKNKECKNVICNSAQLGLIRQIDFFDKEIAQDGSIENYTIIKKNDFVYNPRKSLNAPYGPVNIYNYEEAGIVSPLYLCFSVHDIDKIFLHYYFKSQAWYRFIYLNGDSGARHDRVSIKDEVFFSQNLYLPNAIEQEKIGVFLTLIEQRIDTQSKIIEKYESLIKAISNILIPKTKGKVVTLSEIAKIYQPETITQSKFNENGKYPVFGANGLIGHYNFYNHENAQICITCRGATCGNINLSLPKSWITGNSMVINTDECTRINKMYLYYLLKNYNFKSIISGSGQPQIVREPISAIKINLPTIQDQNEIVKILNTYNELLRKEKDILELYKKQKAYLLKNMFI